MSKKTLYHQNDCRLMLFGIDVNDQVGKIFQSFTLKKESPCPAGKIYSWTGKISILLEDGCSKKKIIKNKKLKIVRRPYDGPTVQ